MLKTSTFIPVLVLAAGLPCLAAKIKISNNSTSMLPITLPANCSGTFADRKGKVTVEAGRSFLVGIRQDVTGEISAKSGDVCFAIPKEGTITLSYKLGRGWTATGTSEAIKVIVKSGLTDTVTIVDK
jgi:hypothetical protein